MAQKIEPKVDSTALGLGLMVLTVCFFTMIDTSAKWLVTAGLPALQVVFARYAMHFILALVVFMPQGGLVLFRSQRPKVQLLRSTFLFLSTILNFTALKFLPITVTTTIMFAGPIVVTLLAIPMLGEKVGRHRLLAVCVGFLGVIVVMQPWGVAFHPAMLLNIGALYFILTRKLAGVESNATSQLWSAGLATACLAPFALSGWVWPQTTVDWTFFLLIGIFGGTGHILAVAAHRRADASILAPVIYIQIVLAGVAGIVFFDTWPTVWTLGGGAIIIAAGIYIWHRERQLARTVTPANVHARDPSDPDRTDN